MNWFTDKLYDLAASPKAGEAAWGELAAQDAMSPRVKANYYEGLEMPKDPRAAGWRSAPRMGDVVAPPGTADWMLPPSGDTAWREAHRFGASGLTPPPARSEADAYRMGGLAATDRYKPNTWRDIDREAIEEQYGGADIHGIKLPPVSRDEPKAWRDAIVGETPADALVNWGLGGTGRAAKAALALGGLFKATDPAEAGVLGKLLRGKPGGPHPGGIHVYHSSPHDFDKFDWNKLRTGEGANVYGSGFYFAENPKVSGQGGEYWDQFRRRFEGTPEGKAAEFLASNNFNRQAAIDFARHQRAGKDVLDILEGGSPVGPRTYEVNINARPELMLDWDKPWQAQPKLVQEVARASGIHPESTGAMGVREMSDAPMGQLTGRRLQDPNSLMIRNMQEAGIPGIRYLDQGSRTGGDFFVQSPAERGGYFSVSGPGGISYGKFPNRAEAAAAAEARNAEGRTYNYVVTDPSKLDILAKYGVVGGAPVGMGALAASDKYGERGD